MNNTPQNTDFSCNFYCTEHVWVPPRVKYALYGNALMWKCIFSSLWVLCSITDCSQIAALIPTPKRSESVTAVYNSSSNITDRIVQRLCHKKSILKGLSGYPCGLWTFWDLTYFSLMLWFAGFCSVNSKKPTFSGQLFFINILPTQTVTAAIHNNTFASVRLTDPEHLWGVKWAELMDLLRIAWFIFDTSCRQRRSCILPLELVLSPSYCGVETQLETWSTVWGWCHASCWFTGLTF